MAASLGVCWHSPTSDRWPCGTPALAEPVVTGPVTLDGTPLRQGCVGCGTQKTVRLHPYRGRECPDCVTLPPGALDLGLVGDMFELGRADAVWRYARSWLAREAAARFGAASERLEAA
jgi:hypothetical protein